MRNLGFRVQLLNYSIIQLLFCLCMFTACRDEKEVFTPETEPVTPPVVNAKMLGFYLLNEGSMGSNKATLDYFDVASGIYHRNIYGDANPSVPKELGDVGNDLAIYGSKLYAVINCSNKVEVMDKRTARRLGQIDIPNCRYIRFHGGYAYITSYAGPVQLDPDYKQHGYVAKVDTATLKVVATCNVGFQPDELEIVGDKIIFVANSGGYMPPNYENTLSVIDLNTFTEVKQIDVAINMYQIRADKYGNLWVTSRGNYNDIPSKLYWVNGKTEQVGGMIDIAVSNMFMSGDSLYTCSTEWSNITMNYEINYAIIDVAKKMIVSRNFITDGTDAEIECPYGIMVAPDTKDIYVTDAKNFVLPGHLYCFDKNGKKKWDARTGDIPGHFAIVYEERP